ncbi:MAG: ribosome biogenesis GTPase [Bradymonadia bacterium]
MRAASFITRTSRPTDLPAVGDWVLATRDDDTARIEHVFSRTSRFARKGAGGDDGQLLAVNLDTVFVVTAVGEDFNPRRIERYVAAVIAGGAAPAIVINKCDLPYDPLELITTLEQAAPGIPTAIVSATTGGLEDLARLLVPGETAALVGSSGVGKC